MIVKSFLTWMDRAGPQERAEAVDMLARAFLTRALGGDRPEDVEAALTSILDDPSPHVRKTLALAFAERADAPHHIVQALAADQPQVGAILIARSPVLTEADLVELAFAVEGMSLAAIAMRPDLPPRVSQAIVKRRVFDAGLAIARNAGAAILEADLADLATHFGDRAELREALLRRPNLPAVVRYILVTRVARRLGTFASGGGFLAGARGQRVVDETVQGAVLAIGEKQPEQLPSLMRHLRIEEELTPALLLRSVLGGDLALLVAALAELTGLDLRRVESLMQARTDAALSALFRRAELPAFLARPLIAAIRAVGDADSPSLSGFSMPVIRAAQGACLDVSGEEGVRLLALLRRYEADAARLESRRLAESLRSRAREEFTHFTLKADQVRQLEELEAEEHFGAIRPYEEIGFEPGQIAAATRAIEEADLAFVTPLRVIDEAAELAAMPRIPAGSEWADLAAAELARERVAPRAVEIPEDDLWTLRPDILPGMDAETTAAEPSAPEPLKQDEPARASVDLRTLIAEWRREREERDAALGLAPAEAADSGPADQRAANEDREPPVAGVWQGARATFGRKVA